MVKKNIYFCKQESKNTQNMEYTVIIEQNPESGIYVGQCLQIPAAISQGNTLEELMENMKDAIDLVLDCYRDELLSESKGKNVIYRKLELA